MRISLLLCMVCFLLGGPVFSQTLRLQLKDRATGEEIMGSQVFIIDPVNNAVLGYSPSDYDGNCFFRLLDPLTSTRFQVKICDPHFKDSLIEFPYQADSTYLVKLDLPPIVSWFTVYYSDKEILDYHVDMGIWDCGNTYLKAYSDSMYARNERSIKRAEADYALRYQKYLAQKAWADSINSMHPQVQALYYPEPAREDVFEVFVYTWVEEEPRLPGGNSEFFRALLALKTLKPEFRSRKNFNLDFSFGGHYVTDVKVSDNKHGVLTKSAKVWKEMGPLLLPSWTTGTINGRAIRLRRDKTYRIRFVYRKM